jgi:hypothetical protein
MLWLPNQNIVDTFLAMNRKLPTRRMLWPFKLISVFHNQIGIVEVERFTSIQHGVEQGANAPNIALERIVGNRNAENFGSSVICEDI